MTTEAVKAIKLVKSQEKAFQRKIPLPSSSPNERSHPAAHAAKHRDGIFGKQDPMFGTQIHEREAYAPCSLSGAR